MYNMHCRREQVGNTIPEAHKAMKGVSAKHMRWFYISVAIPRCCMQLIYSSYQGRKSERD